MEEFWSSKPAVRGSNPLRPSNNLLRFGVMVAHVESDPVLGSEQHYNSFHVKDGVRIQIPGAQPVLG